MPRRDPQHWKPNRRQRRVLTVLMTGVPGLSGYPIQRLAQTGSGTVYLTLDRLERLGWAYGEWEQRDDEKPRRRFYRLTSFGREKVAALLGMEAGSDG